MNLTDYHIQQIELLRTLTVNIQGIKISIDHLTEAVEDVVESLEKSNEPDSSNLGVKLVSALQELSTVLHQKTQYEKSSHDKNYNHPSHNLPYNSRSNLSTYHPDDYSGHPEGNISNAAYPSSDTHDQKKFSDEKNQFEKEDHSDYNPMPIIPHNDTLINKASSFPPIPSNNLNSYSNSNESFRSRGISRRGRPPGGGGHRSSQAGRRSIHPKINSLHNRP